MKLSTCCCSPSSLAPPISANWSPTSTVSTQSPMRRLRRIQVVPSSPEPMVRSLLHHRALPGLSAHPPGHCPLRGRASDLPGRARTSLGHALGFDHQLNLHLIFRLDEPEDVGRLEAE